MNRQIAIRVDRSKLYLSYILDALKDDDPARGLAMTAELAENARRLCNEFRHVIDYRSAHPPKSQNPKKRSKMP